MAHLVEFPLSELTDQELSWLDKYCSWDYDGRELKHLLAEVVRDEVKLWRLADVAASGLVGTRILDRPYGRQLWLELLVGEGLLRNAKSIRSAIHAVGIQAGCTSLAGSTSRPGLSRLYETVLGVRPSATLFREEL